MKQIAEATSTGGRSVYATQQPQGDVTIVQGDAWLTLSADAARQFAADIVAACSPATVPEVTTEAVAAMVRGARVR